VIVAQPSHDVFAPWLDTILQTWHFPDFSLLSIQPATYWGPSFHEL